MFSSFFKRKLTCLLVLFLTLVLCVGIGIGSVNHNKASAATYNGLFQGRRSDLSGEDFYDATNTYAYKGANPHEDESFEYRSYEYYDVSEAGRLNNQVDSEDQPQITVLTHGLGGNASHWSNNSLEVAWIKGARFQFAKTDDSLMSRLENQLLAEEGANLYWAKMTSQDSFELIDLKNKNNIREDGTYIDKNPHTIEKLTDNSKHIILVFEAKNPGHYNNYIYEQFNYMLSKIVYDVKDMNGGLLPRINLIGHSRGGITNLQYALDHPDMVAGLFSIGTPYFGTNTGSTSLGASVVSGCARGLDDITDNRIYGRYYDRWNTHAKYRIKNTMALGGYSDTDFFFDALINDQFEEVPGKFTPALLTAVKWFAKFQSRYFNDTVLTAKLIEFIASKFRDSEYTPSELDSYIQILADVKWVDTESSFWDNLLHLTPIVGCPYFMNDTLVDLPSQLGVDNHTNGDRSYGFEVYGKKFSNQDYNDNGKIRLSAANPAVVHNLEAQDPDLITKIIEKIYVGTFDNCFLYDTVGNGIQIYGVQGNMVENDALHIPCKIGQRDVIGIADHAFDSFVGSQEVKSITIPASVQWLGNAAFSGLPMLQTVIFEEGSMLERIENYCFSGCTKLASINLPEKLNVIGDFAFSQCTSLQKFHLGANVTCVGVGAWRGCVNLSAITVDSDNEKYESMEGVLFSTVTSQLVAYPEAKKNSQYTVPDSILEIGSFAFAGNENLVSINLNQVESIREYAFADCINLKLIVGNNVWSIEALSFLGTAWEKLDTDYHSIGDVLYSYTGTASSVDLSNYQTVSPYAFAFNNNVQEVKFGDNSSLICSFAFLGCFNLSSVFLNNSMGIIELGDNAFGMTSDSIKFIVPDDLIDEYSSSEMWQNYADRITGSEAEDDSHEHKDCDGDGKCDECMEPMPEYGGNGGGNDNNDHEHKDSDEDGKCDECGVSMSEGSGSGGGNDNNDHEHKDSDEDGKCDECSEIIGDGETYWDFGGLGEGNGLWAHPHDYIDYTYNAPSIYKYSDEVALIACLDDYSIFEKQDFKVVFLFEGNESVFLDSLCSPYTSVECKYGVETITFSFEMNNAFLECFGFTDVKFEPYLGAGSISIINYSAEGLNVGGQFWVDDVFWHDPFSYIIVHIYVGLTDIEEKYLTAIEGCTQEDEEAIVSIEFSDLDAHMMYVPERNSEEMDGYYTIAIRTNAGYVIDCVYWENNEATRQEPLRFGMYKQTYYCTFRIIDFIENIADDYCNCNFVISISGEDNYRPEEYPPVVIDCADSMDLDISYFFTNNEYGCLVLWVYFEWPVAEVEVEITGNNDYEMDFVPGATSCSITLSFSLSDYQSCYDIEIRLHIVTYLVW